MASAIGYMTGAKELMTMSPMFCTYTPGARTLLGRDHFFKYEPQKAKQASISEALNKFERSIKLLDFNLGSAPSR